ncbi:MAG: transposase [Elusimicrobiota bacterium]|nr:transposase [Elusimicrobiota bacterium]
MPRWCLMPNHFHFLVLRGERPLSEIMHHMLTGYAVNFNGRHHRAGHLFQNRYKAILCDLEEYLLELVPYIHLNALRAGLVRNLGELGNYKWCGHGAVITGVSDGIMDRDELLSHFGGDEKTAVDKYREVMAEKAQECKRVNLDGGGLIRSLGGMNNALMALRSGEKVFSDQRVLGGGDFVEAVLKAVDADAGSDLKGREELLSDVEKHTGVARRVILSTIRDRVPARARAVYCYLCRERGGVSCMELKRELGISQSGVSKLTAKGRQLIESGKIVIPSAVPRR